MAFNRLFQPYLPVTYRRDPLQTVAGGATVGLGRPGLAQAGIGAQTGAPWQPPPWFQNLPLGGIAGPLAQGIEDVATWPYRYLGAGMAGVTQPAGLTPEQLGAFAPGGRFAPGGGGLAQPAVNPVGAQPMTYLPLAGGPPGAAAATQAMSQFRPVAPRPVVPTVPGAPDGGGRADTAGGPQFRDPINPQIDTAWYHAFQAEHDMKTPEEFYTGLPYDQLKYHKADAGWALDEALDDLEWSRGFERMTGKIPTDDDWKAWWMQNYGRDMRTDRERERDKIARKGGPGRKLPRFRGQEEPEQRPPLWVPPVTYWR